MKKIMALVFSLLFILQIGTVSFAKQETKSAADSHLTTLAQKVDLDLPVKSACLIEASTGMILYSENPFEELPLASVTKIMTLLLVSEALENGSFKKEDMVNISAYAASMGGSQVFLEEGERMSVEELIKCTVIASANDAAVALAELTCGSEALFVDKMNKRAEELGLKNTHFENTTGLDDTTTSHYSSAKDIAVMSRELIKHDIILKYSGVWQDTIRDGEFTLTNTNRLVRYYDGCNGLKTGSTDKAGYCVSASAKRGHMQLIAVVMGSETRDQRNNAAKAMLDYGFSSYTVYEKGEELLEMCEVRRGKTAEAELYSTPVSFVVKREKLPLMEITYEIPEFIEAPLKKDESVGKIIYSINKEKLGESDIILKNDIERIGLWDIFTLIIKRIING